MMTEYSQEEESISQAHNFQLQRSLKLLHGVANGAVGYELEARSLRGIRVIQADAGFLHCKFIVPAHASDINGNWHAGAIATIIDSVGATAIYSVCHKVKVTVNFNIQYHSTAKIQEEVEIEAKANGNRGKLSSVLVEIRNKSKNGRLIAVGTQWTAGNDYRSPQPQAKL
ncbi:putative Major facilitator superfamily protein [Hibiscus syriacus]|uniref:Acyl-coenzyme A thioesterase 13 n=1 Tax=Hibiscus syriacus TaxID=106335 RepID=A0A6A2Y0P1_HIBSY|nr:putative Major facilitator superfamily protein [Hibiscus syriacus]